MVTNQPTNFLYMYKHLQQNFPVVKRPLALVGCPRMTRNPVRRLVVGQPAKRATTQT